jgi:hypothetical protein
MFYSHYETLAALTADRYSNPIYCAELKNVRFQIIGATTGTPVGVWKVQVAEDEAAVKQDVARGVYGTPASETAKWTDVVIPEEAVHGLASGQAWSAGTVTWDGAAAMNLWLSLLDAGEVVRLWYDRTSGGTSNTPTIYRAGRSR